MKQIVFYNTLGRIIYEAKNSPLLIPREGDTVIIPKAVKLAEGAKV